MKVVQHSSPSLSSFRLVTVAALLLALSACSLLQHSEPRVVAIGDIHGDYDAFEEVMTRAGLLDAEGNWSGGNTILVQTGDIADRGPDTRKILRHMWLLQEQAAASGGQFIALVANHEAMNMIGDLRYVHPGEVEAFVTEFTLEEINSNATQALRSQSRERTAVINDPLGPLWYRGLLREPCATAESGIDAALLSIEEELEIVLTHFGIERIIIGHTPSVKGIKSNHGGRVIQIDTGMSAHYGGTNSFLEITEKGLFANDDGVVTRLADVDTTRPIPRCGASTQ